MEDAQESVRKRLNYNKAVAEAKLEGASTTNSADDFSQRPPEPHPQQYSDAPNVPDKLYWDNVCCSLCAADGDSPKRDIFLCENFGVCRTCVCDECLNESPGDVWWCENCFDKLKDCSVCQRVTPGKFLQCRSCVACAHVECANNANNDWECKECKCATCLVTRSSPPDLRCVVCENLYHKTCQPNFQFDTCFTCSNVVGHGVDVQGEDAPQLLGDYEEEDVVTTVVPDDTARRMEVQKAHPLLVISRIQAYAADPKTACAHMAMTWWAQNRFVLTAERFQDLEKMIRVVHGADIGLVPPPQNIPRAIRALVSADVLPGFPLEYVVKGRTYKSVFYRRNLFGVVLQIYLSLLNNRVGRFVSAAFKDCAGRRQFGTRIEQLVAAFSHTKNVSFELGSGFVLLLVKCFLDASPTKFFSSHPFIISLANFDADARTLSPCSKQVYAMMPVRASFKCFDAEGVRVPLYSNDVNLNVVQKDFMRQCFAVICADFKALQDGTDVNLPGATQKIYVIMERVMEDLKEGLDTFNLKHSFDWHCQQCYLYRGAKGVEEEEGEESVVPTLAEELMHESGLSLEELSKRSAQTDAKLRLMFPTGPDADDTYAEPGSTEKTNAEKLAQYGLKANSFSPLLTEHGVPRLFLLDNNPFSLGQVDLLHLHGGVVDRNFKALRQNYGPKLTTISNVLGNASFDTPQACNFYKFEGKVEDFFFVAVALLCLPALGNVSGLAKACEDFAFGFIEYNACTKDDFSGAVQHDLERCINTMSSALPVLEKQYQARNKGKGFETSKIHTMLRHTLECVVACGPLKLSSTLEGEDMHPEVRTAVHQGSMRKDDQATSVLENMAFRRFFLDAAEATKLDLSQEKQIEEGSRFQLNDPKNQSAIATELQTCVGFVNRKLGGTNVVSLQAAREILPVARRISRSMLCEAVCEISNERRKSGMTMSVTGSTQSSSLLVVSFRQSGVEEDLGSCNRTPPCRHHKGVQLHASYARRHTSHFGFPVMFFEDDTQEPFALILRLSNELQLRAPLRVVGKFSRIFTLEIVAANRLREVHDACQYQGKRCL
jgi:hypothetical protein